MIPHCVSSWIQGCRRASPHVVQRHLGRGEAAHLQNVIHRDLKPENLLIEMPGHRVVVADFGVAHFEEEDLLTAVRTGVAERLANYRCSAPEQRTTARSADHRADIFALGLILNEMFTGEVPQGTAYKLIAAVAPHFGYLDPVVEKMIRQDPTERPSSIRAIKDELHMRGVEFVTRQKLDKIAPHPEWMSALHTLERYRSYGLAGAAHVERTAHGATVPATANTVVEVWRTVQEWVHSANAEYHNRLIDKAKRQERREHETLATRQRELEEQALAMERLRKAQLA